MPIEQDLIHLECKVRLRLESYLAEAQHTSWWARSMMYVGSGIVAAEAGTVHHKLQPSVLESKTSK